MTNESVNPTIQFPTVPHGSLRRFLITWSGVLALAFLFLCGGLWYAASTMQTKTDRIFFDAQSLQTNYALETHLATAGREKLLWKSTGAASHRIAGQRALRETTKLLPVLQQQSDSTEERRLAAQVGRDYGVFQKEDAVDTPRAQSTLDGILKNLVSARELNKQQMAATVLASRSDNRILSYTVVLVICVALLLVVAGSVGLWRRIFHPTLQIAQAAQGFANDLRVRVPVQRDDEMGNLARTFNAMADAISGREKERLQFVATVAHDLRNPLVVVGGAASLLKRRDLKLTADERIEWLGNIEKNASNMEDQIADLMDGVQAATGELHFQKSPCNFSSLVAEIVQQYSQTMDTHRVHYAGSQNCFISGDSKRLRRVVMNLLSNAVKYSDTGCAVEVTLQARDGHALFSVRDEGVGIAPEDLPKLFLPFSRLARTETMASGTGLGLSSVKKIIEGHGGRIEVESSLNVGTTLRVFLRLLSAEEAN